MSDNIKIGKIGEELACEYIVKKGYKIIFRNYREKVGEIDIIAMARDRTVVFFEVKTLENKENVESLMPEDNLTSAKLRKLKRICELFVAKHLELINEKRGWRIDLLAIEIGNGLGGGENAANKIRHYENI